MEQGWTQQELAESVQVARNTISQWENGVREPDYEMLSMLADIFDVSVDYLLGRSMFRDDEHEGMAYADAYGPMFDALDGSPEERLRKKWEIDEDNMREAAEDQVKWERQRQSRLPDTQSSTKNITLPLTPKGEQIGQTYDKAVETDDEGLRIIERARKKMDSRDKERMLRVLKAAFEEEFDDEDQDNP